MMSTLARAASTVTATIREMNEAQRRMLIIRTSTDPYGADARHVPDTYDEFLARTSGVLMHEPPARRRIRQAQHR